MSCGAGDVRLFVEPATGIRFRASIAPKERKGPLGVDRRLNAVVFETAAGEWVGSVPVYHNVTLDSLSTSDLLELFDQAVARG